MSVAGDLVVINAQGDGSPDSPLAISVEAAQSRHSCRRLGTARKRLMKDVEHDKLESLCAAFQRQWIASLRDTLKKHHVPEDIAKSICGEFSFDLSMLFDQGEIEYHGTTYRPFVAFTDDDEEPSLIIEPNGPQFHEYAFGTTAEAYDAQ